MFLYSVVILIFIFIYYWAVKANNKFILIFAILLPTLFEGLRDEFVGKDMLGYGSIWFYNINPKNSIYQVIKSAQTPEYAYHLLIYFSKRISSDIHVYMTICAFVKMLMVHLTAWKLKKDINSISFLFGYFCFFYVTGFNLMRQTIAVAICIYALTFLLEKNMKVYISLIVFAYFFHNSALFMLLWPFLLLIKKLKFKYFIIIASSLFVYFSISFLMPLLIGSPLFKSGMIEHYIDSGVNTSKTMILISLSFLCYGCCTRQKEKDEVYLLITSSVISLLFVFLASYIEVAFRIAFYALILTMVLFLYFIKKTKRERRYIFISYYIFLFVLHLYMELKNDTENTLQYSSQILGIS